MINVNDYYLIGEKYSHGDYVGVVDEVVLEGGFKGCYQVKLTDVRTGDTRYWYFKKHILEESHRKYGLLN